MKKTLFATVLIALTTTGCVSKLLPAADTRAMYTFTDATLPAATTSQRLYVVRPDGPSYLASNGLSVLADDGELRSLAGVRLAATPAELLQASWTAALERSGDIVPGASAGDAALLLKTNLRSFGFRSSAGSSTAEVVIAAQLQCAEKTLSNAPGKRFAASEPVSGDGSSWVAALDRTQQAVLVQMQGWLRAQKGLCASD